MEEHTNLIAKGTRPQIWIILLQSEELAFGASNLWTKFSEECLSSGRILTAWSPWKWILINSKDSLVVRMNVTRSFRPRISPRRFTTCSLTSVAPFSRRSSALSRINIQRSSTLLNSSQSSSSSERGWEHGSFEEDVRRKLSSFDVRSAFKRSPRNDRK